MTDTIDPTAPNAYYAPITEVSLTESHWTQKSWGEYKLSVVAGTYGTGIALSAEDAAKVRDAIDAVLAPLEAPSIKTELEQTVEAMCAARWERAQKANGIEDPAPWPICPAETKVAFREAILPLAIAAYNILGKRTKR